MDGVDEGAVESIASWLREKLGLSLFGFDVVVSRHELDPGLLFPFIT